MSQAEFDYYASVSGLPASAKLEEHQRAFWCAQLPTAYPAFDRALGELELAFMVGEQPALAGLALDEARLRYFQIVSGLPAGLAATDYMQDFFLSPGPVEVRRNLFLNPAGAGAKAWTSIGNHAVTANGTQAAGGPVANARWQKYTLTEAAAAGTQVFALASSGLNGMPVLGSTQYIVSAYGLRSAGTATQMGLYQLEEYDAAGVLVSAPFLTIPAAPAAGAWGRNSQVLTTDPLTRFVIPRMRFSGATMAIGDYFGVGAVLAELGATLNPYFDGGFASAQWAGAVDDSASILLG